MCVCGVGGLCIRIGTANTVKDCTWHGRCVQSLYEARHGRKTYNNSDAGHIPSPSLCKVTVQHTRDLINILLRYTKIKTLKKTPAMGGT